MKVNATQQSTSLPPTDPTRPATVPTCVNRSVVCANSLEPFITAIHNRNSGTPTSASSLTSTILSGQNSEPSQSRNNEVDISPQDKLALLTISYWRQLLGSELSLFKQNDHPPMAKNHLFANRRAGIRRNIKTFPPPHGYLHQDDTPNRPVDYKQAQGRCAIKAGFITPDGAPDFPALNKYRQEQAAIRAGFINTDGTTNITGFNRYKRNVRAIKAGFVNPDGTTNMTAYNRHQLENAAFKAGLVNPDGTPNMSTYYKRTRERTAINAGFVNPDGTTNMTAYNRHRVEHAAFKAGYVNPDGTANVTDFRKMMCNKTVKAGCVNPEGI